MYEVYAKVRDSMGLTDYRVSKETGINPATFSEWKKGKYRPKTEKIKQLADFLGVSVEYITTGKDQPKESTSGEKYYFDDESAAYADFLHKNPDYKVLFDASRKVKPEDIEFVRQMIERTTNHD